MNDNRYCAAQIGLMVISAVSCKVVSEGELSTTTIVFVGSATTSVLRSDTSNDL